MARNLTDLKQGFREMRRVVRENGVVAICMWDLAGGMEMLAAISRARRVVDENPVGDETLTSWKTEEMRALLEDAALRDVTLETVTRRLALSANVVGPSGKQIGRP